MQVLSSVLLEDTGGYISRDDFVADTGRRRRQVIQVDTTCIRATCIRCKRVIMARLHLYFVSICIHVYSDTSCSSGILVDGYIIIILLLLYG